MLRQRRSDHRPGLPDPYTTDRFFHISGHELWRDLEARGHGAVAGAKMAGCWLNTGEGGLSDYHLEGGCDIVFQIGTAKYGVRTPDGGLDEERLRAVAAHEQVRMFELKLSQGAKPGKGGILPGGEGHRRRLPPSAASAGHDSISPNRHPEIDSRRRPAGYDRTGAEMTGKPVGFKAVMGGFGWLETCSGSQRTRVRLHAGLHHGGLRRRWQRRSAHALMDNVGLPVRESLPLVVDALMKTGLRERVRCRCERQADQPGGCRLGLVCRRRFRDLSTRLHVCTGLYPGHEVQPEYLSYRRSRPTTSACSAGWTRRPKRCG